MIVETPLDILIKRERTLVIDRILSTLSQREAITIKLYFGLAGGGRMETLEEIGKDLGLTRERIRQIKKRAIYRLRHWSRSAQLRPYLTI